MRLEQSDRVKNGSPTMKVAHAIHRRQGRAGGKTRAKATNLSFFFGLGRVESSSGWCNNAHPSFKNVQSRVAETYVRVVIATASKSFGLELRAARVDWPVLWLPERN